jgi:hypothetical protein
MYTLLMGDPLSGFSLHGLFETKADAEEAAEKHFRKCDWWIMKLQETVMARLKDGWKTPQWDDRLVYVPYSLLQECELALSDVRGLIQRLSSHSNLDARDKRALEWGTIALTNVRKMLRDAKPDELVDGR